MKVLLVEDEKLVRVFIVEYFKKQGALVVEAENGYEAIKKLDDSYDIVLLDIMMPGIDGYEVCRLIRQKNNIPILFISALSQEDDRLKGYEVGADDYITKPFTPSLLYAKCKALLKRIKTDKELVEGIISVNEDNHQVMVNGKEVLLSHKEYYLLVYLMKNKNKVVTREQLLDQVWGYDYYGDQRIVDTYIKKLRKKLNEGSEYIQTIVKSGYMFTKKGIK